MVAEPPVHSRRRVPPVSGSFSMPVGKTYTLWAVDTDSGAKSIAVSPVRPATVPAPAPAPVLPPGACRVGIRLLGSAVGIHPLTGDATVILVDTVANTRYSAHANARGFAWMTVPTGAFDLTIKIGGHTRLHRAVWLAGSVYTQTYRLTVPGVPRRVSPQAVPRSASSETD